MLRGSFDFQNYKISRQSSDRWKLSCSCSSVETLTCYSTWYSTFIPASLQWRHTSVTIIHSIIYSRRRSKKISKIRVTGLCEENSPVTGEFPAQRASNVQMFPFDDVVMNYALENRNWGNYIALTHFVVGFTFKFKASDAVYKLDTIFVITVPPTV